MPERRLGQTDNVNCKRSAGHIRGRALTVKAQRVIGTVGCPPQLAVFARHISRRLTRTLSWEERPVTTGWMAVAVGFPVIVSVMTFFAVRSQYRARAADESKTAAHVAATIILICAAVVIVAGARWWLVPSWPSLSIWSMVASTIIGSLWASSVGRVMTKERSPIAGSLHVQPPIDRLETP